MEVVNVFKKYNLAYNNISIYNYLLDNYDLVYIEFA